MRNIYTSNKTIVFPLSKLRKNIIWTFKASSPKLLRLSSILSNYFKLVIGLSDCYSLEIVSMTFKQMYDI